MSLTCGIVGLPNAGKSTIFNALSSSKALVADYPFTTIEPNVGIVNIPDERLTRLAEIIEPQKVIPTTLKFIDIAGLVKGASKGEGLGNRFLGTIRGVDSLIHVIRCFESGGSHVIESIDPRRDVEIVNLELLLADLETVEKRKNKLEKPAKSGIRDAQAEFGFLEQIHDHLTQGNSARHFVLSGQEEERLLKGLNLLTIKSVLYVANLEEGTENKDYIDALKEIAAKEDAGMITIYGKLELELLELPEDEAILFLAEMGLSESGLIRLVKASSDLLDLITFYTTNGIELRAWSIKRGTEAPRAAGKIHSDFEEGFIRAEVISYDDYVRCGSDTKVRESGLLRIEGRNYQIEDGNMVYFRFKN